MAATPIDLSKAVQKALKDIYEKKVNPHTEIQPDIFRGFVDTFDLAVAEGFKESPAVSYDFKERILHSNEVFSAFKVHRMQEDMAARLLDGEGNLKSFEQFAEDVKGITSHQCRQWLRTEYDTAIKRAQLAADWQRFEDEKDVLPNLRWVPSTAAEPNAEHRAYWNTVLPVNHPFWSQHKPGDRWGCQCSLEATDDPVTKSPTSIDHADPGLDNNPGKDGRIFSESHPYFPDSCQDCPFSKSVQSGVFTNKAKDCSNCPYILDCIDKVGCKPDKEYGQRLLISNEADMKELDDNVRAAKAILSSFPDEEIQIRRNVFIEGVKNPEYSINKLVADRKGIESENGVSAGFSQALKQGCSSVVIDLDMNMYEKKLNSWELAKHIQWRNQDFLTGKISSCYIVYHGKAVKITSRHFRAGTDNARREAIAAEIKQLKPQ